MPDEPIESREEPGEEQKQAAMDMVRAVYEDGTAEINGREYTFTKTDHKKRRRVFAFYSSVGNDIKNNNFSFLSSREFQEVEKIIENMVTFEDVQLSKRANHWDNYPEDYITFIGTALAVISYPFMRANATG